MATKIKSPRIAIVSEWLWNVRGAEKLLDSFLEIFPQADVYALFGNIKNLSEMKELKSRKVFFSFLQKLPFIHKYYRYTYFLWPLAIESFKFNNYDIVISLSSSVAKGVVTSYKTKHICYMNTPMRYAWDLTFNYFNKKNFSLWKRIVIPFFLNYLRVWDFSSNSRIDYLIANSNFIKDRIHKYYKIEADKVIFPSISKPAINLNIKKKSYYYFHSAHEPNKGIIETVQCAIKYNFPLKISSSGSLTRKIKKMIKGRTNIELLGWVSDQEKYKRYFECKAFLFPSIEDFGIVILEANSVGTPVLALNYGGVKDIVLDGVTGVLIETQKVEDIYDGILRLDKIKFDREKIIKHSERFSFEKFKDEIINVVNKFVDTNSSF